MKNAILLSLQATFNKLERARIGLAVSGGIDSQVLFHAAASLANAEYPMVRLFGLHVVHNLRSASEQSADIEAVLRISVDFGIPLFVLESQFNSPPLLSSRESGGLEADARTYRYRLLGAKAQALGLDALFLAQHLDDRMEHFVLKAFSSSEPDALLGFGGLSDIYRRPFFSLRKQELLAYAHRFGLAWHEDSSNSDTALLRNKIRKELLPSLAQYFPGIHSTLPRLLAKLEEQRMQKQPLELVPGWQLEAGGYSLERRALDLRQKSSLKKGIKKQLYILQRDLAKREPFFAALTGMRPNRAHRISDAALAPLVAALERGEPRASVEIGLARVELDERRLRIISTLEKSVNSGYLVGLDAGAYVRFDSWELYFCTDCASMETGPAIPQPCWVLPSSSLGTAEETGAILYRAQESFERPKNLPRTAHLLSILKEQNVVRAILGQLSDGSGFVADASGRVQSPMPRPSSKLKDLGPVFLIWRHSSER